MADAVVLGVPIPDEEENPRCMAPSAATCDDAAIAAALQAEEEHAVRLWDAGRGPQAAARGGAGEAPAVSEAWPPLGDFGDEGAEPLVVDTRSPRRRLLQRVCAGVLLLLLVSMVVAGYFIAVAVLHRGDENPGVGSTTGEQLVYVRRAFENISRAALDDTNRYRVLKGLRPLQWHDGMAEIAAEFAEQITAGQAAFSHTGFPARVARFPFRYSRAGENLGMCLGYPDIAGCAVNGWIQSPEHEKNLVGSFDLCGIGTAQNASDGRYYLNQLFAATA